MAFTVVRSIAATRAALPSARRVATLPIRTYANSPTGQSRASPGQSSNVSGTNASSPEGQGILNSRATDGRLQQDTKSTQTPISHPEEGGLGGQEETTPSQAAMKRDPNEPAEEKRKKVLEYGQNRKLDPANDLKPNEGKATGESP